MVDWLVRSRFGRIPAVSIPEAEAGADGVQSQSVAETGTRLREESLRGGCGTQAAGADAQPHRNAGQFQFRCVALTSVALTCVGFRSVLLVFSFYDFHEVP